MTSGVDWFRKTSWSSKDREDFELHLKRAQPSSRPQYLRIQAGHLAAASLESDALVLLERVNTVYPESDEVGVALGQKGACLLRLGQPTEALAAYRDAIERMRTRPKMISDAWLDYGLAVGMLGEKSQFENVLEILAEFSSRWPIWQPRDKFRLEAAKALIGHQKGIPISKQHAFLALEMVGAEMSERPLRPKAELIVGRHGDVVGRLQSISSSHKKPRSLNLFGLKIP